MRCRLGTSGIRPDIGDGGMAMYLVTGGAGFIGSHLVEGLLKAGHRVRVLDDLSSGRRANVPSGVPLIEADASDQPRVLEAMKGCDGVFHLAAVASVQKSNEAWPATHRANQSATVCVMDSARASGRIPVVYASSAAIYGDAGRTMAHEDRRPAPMTAYGADKLGSELHGSVAWRIHGVATFGCRFFNVYGPRQDPSSPYSGVISIFMDRAARGEALSVFGDGSQTRDFVYVGDVAAALRRAMTLLQTRPAAYVSNICTGQPTTVLEAAGLISAALNSASAIEAKPPRAGDIAYSLGSTHQMKALLGEAAATQFKDGLALLAASLGAARPVIDAPSISPTEAIDRIVAPAGKKAAANEAAA
jgi:UDP-glucose 4-epimerase